LNANSSNGIRFEVALKKPGITSIHCISIELDLRHSADNYGKSKPELTRKLPH
jgi:hypothetical protein